MNFFAQQDRARQNTNQLIGLFVGAVLSIVICIYLATILTINFSSLKPVFYPPCKSIPSVQMESGAPTDTVGSNQTSSTNRFGRKEFRSSYSSNNYSQRQNHQSNCQISTSLWHPQVFLVVLISTSLIIGGASWSKTNKLKAGGAVIAVELGGRRILPEIATPAEQQLLNVVEEMAIASGVPTPGVYLLDHEFGMNAFAAGFKPEDAVIGVTKGLLENLDRDELQGVIAHEFSHILNGDMMMNLRLVGMLHGILFVYLTGRVISAPRLGQYNIQGSFSNNNFVGYFGLALMAIGSSGLLGGRLIQSAISRQREFLADASAVQFTRNPEGIAGALAKLADASSEIVSPYAETTSHMFFGSALGFNWFGNMFATHPALEIRIARVRGLAGKFISKKESANGAINSDGVMGFAGNSNMGVSKATPSQVRSWLDELPSLLQAALQEEYRSISIIYALLLDPDRPDVRATQLEYLQQVEDPAILSHIAELHESISQQVEARWHLSLLDRAIDQLRSASAKTQKRLLKCAAGTLDSLTSDTWHSPIVYLILEHRLHPQAAAVATSNGLLLQELWPESLTVLATMARAGKQQSDAILHAFQTGLFRLPSRRGSSVEIPAECDWQRLQVCLEQLAHARLPDRKTLVTACAEVVTINRQVTDREADLLRMIAIMLDCPLPPLLNNFARTKGNRTSENRSASPTKT
jgi:Zn-dependent protease with chaperone function